MQERNTDPLENDPDLWHHRADAIVAVCEAASWSIDLKTAYQNMANAVAEAFAADQAYLHLLTTTGDYFTECASYHKEDIPSGKERVNFPVVTGRMMWMIENQKPIIMDYLNPHEEDEIPEFAVSFGYLSAVSIPLVAGSDTLGMLSIVFRQPKTWNNGDVEYMMAVGRVLGTSVQRVQAAKKDVELQILDEHKRLSAEIHDNLSQLITSIKISAETALMAFEEGDRETIRRDLERLASTSKQVIGALRDEMFSLRAPTDRTDSLETEIKRTLENFSMQWGIATELKTLNPDDPIIVSTQADLQLMRILHESLSNALRHSRAKNITVSLVNERQRLSMLIADDGCGFDPDAVSAEHLGIKIMRERANALKGKLTIESEIDLGTTVQVDIPNTAWI